MKRKGNELNCILQTARSLACLRRGSPFVGRRRAHARAAGLSVSVFSVDVVSNLVNSRKINSNMEWAEWEL
jgi:hypothetical protein